MNLLLDTHVWLWSLLEPEKLTKSTRNRLQAQETALWLSPISAWEALMLIERGRLHVPGDGPSWVETAWRSGPFREAPLTFAVAAASRRLAAPVRDPADRFLAASALVYGCAFVTADRRLKVVPGVRVLRA